MGGKESKVHSVVEEEIAKINHQRFANRRFITNNNGEEFILIKVLVPSEKQYHSWKDSLAKIQNQEALLLPNLHSFDKTGLCGSNGVVQIIYQKYPFILSDQIHNRECLNSKYFEENQLWYLAFTLLQAAHYFHGKGRKIGDIRPQNIFISEDGSVKVACLQSWPMETTNYEKSFEKLITYISPEEVTDLKFAKTESSSNLQLAETFSIGLTVLDAATLGDSTALYSLNNQFYYEELESRLKQLDTLDYGIYLRLLIRNLLQIIPEKRNKAVQLYNWLLPYEEDITNFTTFEPKNLPSKFPSLVNNLDLKPVSNTSLNNYNTFGTNIISHSVFPIQQQYTTFNPTTSISYQSKSKTHFHYNQPPIDYKPIAVPQFNAKREVVNHPPYQYNPVSAHNVPRSSDYASIPQPIAHNTIVESTYVPYTSKFSLDKIDEQLNNSRKMFPS